ncbi:hypothetical protein [Aquimonas voraii]|uniref:hypothetical protein n=1 Tax=Aquimonas voraii TaxID=265719 RepID=UPI00115F98E2|nr:hypothetical protein [Aquimonas voraii]
MNRFRALKTSGLLLALSCAGSVIATPLDSAFSYQGELRDAGAPANGLYDLELCLFDQFVGASALACVSAADVPVQNGLFTTAVDFGSGAFIGQQRYLELRVRPGARGGAYTPLAPRQLIRAVPEAVRAASSSVAPWSGLIGVPAGFADGVDDDSGGTVSLVAAGTGLSGGPITGSGTLSIANGGVGSLQLADAAVTAAKLANSAVATAALADASVTSSKIAAGAVGGTQINPAEVQTRIGSGCPAGTFIRAVDIDGSLQCEAPAQAQQLNAVDEMVGGGSPFFARSSLAVPADGLPVIGYYDGNTQMLRVAKCQNPSCSFSGRRSLGVAGLNASLALGSDQLPVISSRSGTDVSVSKCADPFCGSATSTVIDTATVDSTSLAVPSDGLPVVAYSTTAGALKVARCSTAACTGAATITTVLANGNAQYASLALGADGLPLLVYSDLGSVFRVLKCSTVSCAGSTTISALDGGTQGLTAAIALGHDGLPVISFWGGSQLRVAKCANPACSGGTIVSVIDTLSSSNGLVSSITVDAAGIPIIAYADNSGANTKVARCGDAACSGAATITAFDVFGSASIAIGADGLPVMSNQSASALRVFKCGTPNCR